MQYVEAARKAQQFNEDCNKLNVEKEDAVRSLKLEEERHKTTQDLFKEIKRANKVLRLKLKVIRLKKELEQHE